MLRPLFLDVSAHIGPGSNQNEQSASPGLFPHWAFGSDALSARDAIWWLRESETKRRKRLGKACRA
jgi:hypothetical protein